MVYHSPVILNYNKQQVNVKSELIKFNAAMIQQSQGEKEQV